MARPHSTYRPRSRSHPSLFDKAFTRSIGKTHCFALSADGFGDGQQQQVDLGGSKINPSGRCNASTRCGVGIARFWPCDAPRCARPDVCRPTSLGTAHHRTHCSPFFVCSLLPFRPSPLTSSVLVHNQVSVREEPLTNAIIDPIPSRPLFVCPLSYSSS